MGADYKTSETVGLPETLQCTGTNKDVVGSLVLGF